MKTGEGDLIPEVDPAAEEVSGEAAGDQETEETVEETGDDQETGGGEVTQEQEYQEQECEEASPGQHNSSGYASDGSGAGNNDSLQSADTNTAAAAAVTAASIQSDPHQSAFRPAGAVPLQYHEQAQHAPDQYQHQQQQYHHRQQQPGPAAGQHGWQPDPAAAPADMSGYGPPIGMMTQAAHHPMMHTPIARRPITGNMSAPMTGNMSAPMTGNMSGGGYPGPGPGTGYRPQNTGHYAPTSPGTQYRQAAYSGAQMAGWGSPNWSANGPPSGPPPMSMTPPPLSWNQPNNQRRPPANYHQNKPFGNVQYGGVQQQHQQVRSKNYPFPQKPMTQDCMEDMYGGGPRGPLDTMRQLEHYLPDHGGQRPEDMVGPDGSSSAFFGSSRSSPRSHSSQNYDADRFSRKVFVGGLPPDIDEGEDLELIIIDTLLTTLSLSDEITASFRRFGPLVVDWPHKAESKSYFPPKGYAFLLFQVQTLEANAFSYAF